MTLTHPIAAHQTESLLFFSLLQLTIIVLSARLGGELARSLGQSTAVGEIVVGILLGPSLFGLLAPQLFDYVFHSGAPQAMQILSQVGLVLLMFQIGLEFDFSHLTEKRNRKSMLWIAAASLVGPFLLGYMVGHFSTASFSPSEHPEATALFIATAFSITALPILGRIMIEFKMTRSSIGVIAISAAGINDVVGWLLLALITSITTSDFNSSNFAIKVLLVAAFFTVSWFGLRPLMKRILHVFDTQDGILSHNLLGVVLAAIFLSAMTTYQIGIFAIFGGFTMGVILHDEEVFVKSWRTHISPFIMVFFLPIFFTYTGLRTNIGTLADANAWGWCLLIVSLATIGKFGGAYIAARLTGLNHTESKILGVLMNTRALMELIVINVGYDLGVISQQMFTILVIMAIFSTIITSPLLRRWLPKINIADTQ